MYFCSVCFALCYYNITHTYDDDDDNDDAPHNIYALAHTMQIINILILIMRYALSFVVVVFIVYVALLLCGERHTHTPNTTIFRANI